MKEEYYERAFYRTRGAYFVRNWIKKNEVQCTAGARRPESQSLPAHVKVWLALAQLVVNLVQVFC